jgi:hypothetical protein
LCVGPMLYFEDALRSYRSQDKVTCRIFMRECYRTRGRLWVLWGNSLIHFGYGNAAGLSKMGAEQ